MAPEEQTSKEQVQEPTAKKTVAKAKKNKLICKGPSEVSIHLIDEGIEVNAADGKVGVGAVRGTVLVPGQFVDISEVPEYQISDEIKEGTHPGLELVTAQEASIYKPTPEGDIVSAGMDIPTHHLARK